MPVLLVFLIYFWVYQKLNKYYKRKTFEIKFNLIEDDAPLLIKIWTWYADRTKYYKTRVQYEAMMIRIV
jgi:hypothetical protein